MVATRTELRATTEAKVKTDDRDARTLARLLAAGLLGGCWLPDEQTRALRRRLARRAQLVRQQTRAKNEVHAVLMRTLKGRPPMSDVFGRGGRVWLAELELPVDERETVDGCLRQIEREPVWRPAGTGIYLPGNATRALRARPRGAGCVPVRRNPAAALL